MKKSFLTIALKGSKAGTNIRKCIFILAFGLLGLVVSPNPPLASQQQIGMFLNSTTCVVIENSNISYNSYVKDAVQKYWKSTKFEFIDEQEFKKRRSDTKYSFLVLMKGVYDKDPDGIAYSYMSLVLGDAATDMTDMPELCSIPISYSDENSVDYGYAIPSIIKFMQIHAKNLENKRFIISLQGLRYYNKSGYKDKVLLLNKEMMGTDANSLDKIKAVYPYFVKLLSTTEIMAELASNPTSTLINFHVGPTQKSGSGKCFDMIFDVEGNLYYYSSRKITNDNKDGFNLNDFSHIR